MELTWLATYKYSQIQMRRDGRSEAESGHPLGWEWPSPHASFDESTPVQSPPRSGLSTTLSLPQNNAPHQRPFLGLGWGNTAMSSSLQDPTPSRAGCRPRWSWEPTYTFLGLALPQHLNKRRAPKRNQPSLFKKALLGRRCLFTRTML